MEDAKEYAGFYGRRTYYHFTRHVKTDAPVVLWRDYRFQWRNARRIRRHLLRAVKVCLNLRSSVFLEQWARDFEGLDTGRITGAP